MKYLLLIVPFIIACSMLGGGSGEGPSVPKVREDAVQCPEAPECEGKYKSGVVCLPSGEHHSAQNKCPFKK